MVVASGLDDFSDLAVCVTETRVGFLYCETGDFGTEVGLRNTESWVEESQIDLSWKLLRNTYIFGS